MNTRSYGCIQRVWLRIGLAVLLLTVTTGLMLAGDVTANAGTSPLLRPAQGEVNDYRGGLEDLVFGPQYVLIDGRILELEQNGPGGLFRGLLRSLGVGRRAFQAAKVRAKPLGLNPGLLLAAEKIARVRARQLTQLLPPIERERFKTIAVGIGRDRHGVLRIVIGTNNRNGTLPGALRAAVQRSREPVATGMGSGHAEVQVVRWMLVNRWRPITVGAGRPICPECADAIARVGATAASVLK